MDPLTKRVTTLTGRSDCRSTIDGAWGHAAFNNISAVTYSAATQSLVVADAEENAIREIR